MARRVLIRSRNINTAVAQMEDMLRSQYNAIWKKHRDELEEAAEQIESDAHYLVPKQSGALDDSIFVYVTNSRRYPGIIASASAKGQYRPGTGGYAAFDYAIVQEEEEEFSHESPEYSAHYLGGPFALNISELYYDITGKELKLSPELEHAKYYVEDQL